MTPFQFWFLVGLICMVAQGIYAGQARAIQPDASKGLRRAAVALAVIVDLGFALGVGLLARSLSMP